MVETEIGNYLLLNRKLPADLIINVNFLYSNYPSFSPKEEKKTFQRKFIVIGVISIRIAENIL